jgi:hypothetical protein
VAAALATTRASSTARPASPTRGPTTQALRRGPYYVLHAVNARGLEVRVVTDAQLGDIISISPLVLPRYDSGPRIIHVPQPGRTR